ncbi:hypothetical protein LX32DRAFT_332936 [Colletotrichum zoysiae]|uniref:Uncharacterized protein n=1 Tax=Colletotrichum zoysiae TaxID=1216348 RepID=A0AAD9M347_9PEZI|nr:hypothetical protein LX32DRAFT_332936 [Colletotrichum zoysiae]
MDRILTAGSSAGHSRYATTRRKQCAHAVHASKHAKVCGRPCVMANGVPDGRGQGTQSATVPPVLPVCPRPVLSSPTSLLPSRMIPNPAEWTALLDRQRWAKEEHQCAPGSFGRRAALARFAWVSREGFVHALMNPRRGHTICMRAALSYHPQPRGQLLLRRRTPSGCSAPPYDCDVPASWNERRIAPGCDEIGRRCLLLMSGS